MATDKRQAVKVEVPGSSDDTVKFARVGIIALAGFAIGIAWPRLAGVKLVPSVPVPAAAEASARELTGAPQKPPEADGLPIAASAPSEKPAPTRLLVSDAQVASCRSKHDKRVEACDRVDFDRVARERLRELSTCSNTENATGVLSLGFELDFEKDKIKNIHSGKSTSLAQDDVERLLTCARESFSNLSLVGIPHEQGSYTLFYRLELLAPEGLERSRSAAPSGSGNLDADATPASGRATVSWDVALVRSSPARDGEVLARVLSGTRIVVTGKNGDWFRVKYDAKGNQGWVYRTAIGM